MAGCDGDWIECCNRGNGVEMVLRLMARNLAEYRDRKGADRGEKMDTLSFDTR